MASTIRWWSSSRRRPRLRGEKSGVIKVFSSLTDTDADARTPTSRTTSTTTGTAGCWGWRSTRTSSINGRLYVSYTSRSPHRRQAPRWGDGCPDPPATTPDGCVVSGRLSVLTNGGSENVLIEDWCQQFPSHSMSDIVFDAEGALIVNGGDGANFNGPTGASWAGSLPDSPHPAQPVRRSARGRGRQR